MFFDDSPIPKKKQSSKNENNIRYPPLFIKCPSEQRPNEQIEYPLQQYIDNLYLHYKQKKKLKKIVKSFMKQNDEGNVEYKLKLLQPSQDRIQHLATQMKFRVNQGSGEAYYRIGVQDNGKPTGLNKEQMYQSLQTICYIAQKLRNDVLVLNVGQGFKGLIAELMIRKLQRQGIKLEIRLLLIGESGSGKTTLLGVLKTGQKDDGKGHSRMRLFSHKHQFMSGTTMTKSHHIIGFDNNGKLYNQQALVTLQKWFDSTSKIISFIDVGGHKKAEKQLVSSLCSFFPEYALWVVSGLSGTKTEQQLNIDTLKLAQQFNLPLIVVITHLDLMSKDQEIQAICQIKKVLKQLYSFKTPCIINEMEYAVLFSRITSTQDVIPIFLVSNVTGHNLDLLTNFLKLLTSVSPIKNNQEMDTQFLISDKYIVDQNIILAGTVIKGSIKKSQILHLGPDLKGTFRAVEVNSIECLRVPVKLAKSGQICTVAIRLMNYSKEWLTNQPNAIRRGMVLVQSKSNPKAAYQFLASFAPYSAKEEEIKITKKYEPVINTLTTRQICNIVSYIDRNKEQNDCMKIEKKKSKSIDFKKKSQSFNSSKSFRNVSTKQKTHQRPYRNSIQVDCVSQIYEQENKREMELKKKHKASGQKEVRSQEVKDLKKTKNQNQIAIQKKVKNLIQERSQNDAENTNSTSITNTQCQDDAKEQKQKQKGLMDPKIKGQIKEGKQQTQGKYDKETKETGQSQKALETIVEEGKKKKKQLTEIVINGREPTLLRLRFKYFPEYISVGQKVVINELRMIGQVKEIYY